MRKRVRFFLWIVVTFAGTAALAQTSRAVACGWAVEACMTMVDGSAGTCYVKRCGNGYYSAIVETILID